MTPAPATPATPPPSGPRTFRFAPTPSRELHVGNGLAALVGWARARAVPGARIFLRIEDIDRARCKPAYETMLHADLAWLGLDWDLPVVPTSLRQSERTPLYNDALAGLLARGQAYVCTCSRADIRAAQSAPQLGVPTDVYPGTCRGLGRRLSDLQAGAAGGVRFDVAALGDAARVVWSDELLGVQTIDDVRLSAGDTLLGRPDAPTYQLAVVVDDLAMGVTDIVRGRDLVDSTARQILLQRVLAPEAQPRLRFHHHPILLDADGRKLSKRDGDLALSTLRAQGVPVGALRAALGRAIGLFATGVRTASVADWVDAVATVAPERLHDGTWGTWTPGTAGP